MHTIDTTRSVVHLSNKYSEIDSLLVSHSVLDLKMLVVLRSIKNKLFLSQNSAILIMSNDGESSNNNNKKNPFHDRSHRPAPPVGDVDALPLLRRALRRADVGPGRDERVAFPEKIKTRKCNLFRFFCSRKIKFYYAIFFLKLHLKMLLLALFFCPFLLLLLLLLLLLRSA